MCSEHNSNNGYNAPYTYSSAKSDLHGFIILIAVIAGFIGIAYAVSFIQGIYNSVAGFISNLF